MLDKYFILHLSLIDGIGPGIIQKIIQRSDVNASDLYLFTSADWINVVGLTEKTAHKLVAGLADKKILMQELYLIEKNNVQWITILDVAYPRLLHEIYLAPAVLYFRGELSEALKSIAFVGSRKADAYGYRAVNTLIPDLVTAGYTIVSGGALGIDTAAHDVTLKCGGKTIAVLGSGLLKPHPTSNKKLFDAIINSGGAVVSYFPLLADPLPGNFPARNRIITGLSRGCVVVQAAQKSGALISAHCALEQGREVFAVPGPFDHELSMGCNGLIQQGAKLVICSADILSEFGDRVILQDKRITENEVQQTLFQAATLISSDDKKSTIYSEAQEKIIRACKQPSSLDDIVSATQLSFETVQFELFNLQLDGCVEQDFTGMWTALR